MRRPTSMTAWAAFLASLLLLQECSSIPIGGRLAVSAAAILHRDAAYPANDGKLSQSAELSRGDDELDEHDSHEACRRRKRQINPETGDSSHSIATHLHDIAADTATSPLSSVLPWCSDLSDPSLQSPSISTASSTSNAVLSTSSRTGTPSLITSSSEGRGICVALPTSSSISSSPIPSIASSSSSSRKGVQTIIVPPTQAAQSNARPRSTRTVTAVQTLQRQVIPAPTTTVIRVTSTVLVLSTTTHLNTVYTTITPRPTAAWLTL